MDPVLAALERARTNRLDYYLPYGHPDTLCPKGAEWRFRHDRGEWDAWSNKPWQYDFHANGAVCQERMLMAANRPGKTVCAAAEVAYHMTGNYPDWWVGRRFDSKVLVWTGSPTNESSRNIVQKELLGGTDPESLGTGWIPRHLLKAKPKMRQAGVSDVVDSFKVKHRNGGVSECILKTYEQGWRTWQGSQPQVVWMDEEPDYSKDQKGIYSEALTRLLTSHGIMMVTFTPLLGVTDLVAHYREPGEGKYLGTATWEDAPHLLKTERERLASSYPAYERQARMRGVPMLGEGAVFPVGDEDIVVPRMHIPEHFVRIAGIDFGMDHPTAVAWLAYDRDRDVVYLYDCYKREGRDALYHAKAIQSRGAWIPVAWPHDGANREKGSGKTLKDIYSRHGVRLLSKSARYRNEKGGSQPVWPIIDSLVERMKTDRFKVFADCHDWLDEFRMYHVKDGKLTIRNDDVLKASFYALMMLRYAAGPVTRHAARTAAPVFSMRLG